MTTKAQPKEAAHGDEATRPAVQSGRDGHTEGSEEGHEPATSRGADKPASGEDAGSNRGHAEGDEPRRRLEAKLVRQRDKGSVLADVGHYFSEPKR